MLHLVQMLYHTCVIETIGTRRREEEPQEVEQCQSTHQLGQQVENVETADVDRLLERVLSDVDGDRETSINPIECRLMLIDNMTNFIARSDARRFILVTKEAHECVSEDIMKVLIDCDHLTDKN